MKSEIVKNFLFYLLQFLIIFHFNGILCEEGINFSTLSDGVDKMMDFGDGIKLTSEQPITDKDEMSMKELTKMLGGEDTESEVKDSIKQMEELDGESIQQEDFHPNDEISDFASNVLRKNYNRQNRINEDIMNQLSGKKKLMKKPKKLQQKQKKPEPKKKEELKEEKIVEETVPVPEKPVIKQPYRKPKKFRYRKKGGRLRKKGRRFHRKNRKGRKHRKHYRNLRKQKKNIHNGLKRSMRHSKSVQKKHEPTIIQLKGHGHQKHRLFKKFHNVRVKEVKPKQTMKKIHNIIPFQYVKSSKRHKIGGRKSRRRTLY
ncbi:hypothetical protein SNEBB_005230 [Seison nebaliae]|nr:hypothetical protein SNEBB_005230 [Seison nebaliae]